MRGSTSLVLLLALASSCDAPAPEREPPSPSAPDPARPEPEHEAAPPPVLEPELEPPSPPSKPTFDPKRATEIRARILAIPNRDNWVACGIHHSVGVLEVEVLDVGDPPPRMLLFLSCPVDSRASARGLRVGAIITATLHARPQRWSSVAGLPEDLPRRYVESFAVPGTLGDPG
jgi:hypothetical protein